MEASGTSSAYLAENLIAAAIPEYALVEVRLVVVSINVEDTSRGRRTCEMTLYLTHQLTCHFFPDVVPLACQWVCIIKIIQC